VKRTRGLGVVFQQPKSSNWWIQYSVRGRRIRETSGSINRADAVQLLKQRIGEVQAGKPVGSQIEKTTLSDLTAMLIDDYRAHGRRSIDRAEDAVERLHQFFDKDTRAIGITADRITAYRAHRQQQTYKGKPVANATINYELAMLRRAFRLAARAGRVAARPEFEMLHVDNARTGFFEADQFVAVVDRLPNYLRPVTQTAYITGWRTKSELLTRQWRHVDLDAGWLRLDPGEGKTGEARNFPLTADLHAIFETQREHVSGIERATGQIVLWLFCHSDGTRIRNFRYAWAKACKAAGVPGRLVHDLRRTAVRNLERAGVPRSAAMKMTGHKTETVYRRYAIVDEGMMRDAANKLAALHGADRHHAAAHKVVSIRER
jgi:integrase